MGMYVGSKKHKVKIGNRAVGMTVPMSVGLAGVKLLAADGALLWDKASRVLTAKEEK